jgi:hypothetical protein
MSDCVTVVCCGGEAGAACDGVPAATDSPPATTSAAKSDAIRMKATPFLKGAQGIACRRNLAILA